MNEDEKKALRVALAAAPRASVSIRTGDGQCYRYQIDPFASRGYAVRSPVAGRVRWHATPGPVAAGAHLADVLVGGAATPVHASAAGDLGRPLAPDDGWVDHQVALAVIHDPE